MDKEVVNYPSSSVSLAISWSQSWQFCSSTLSGPEDPESDDLDKEAARLRKTIQNPDVSRVEKTLLVRFQRTWSPHWPC